MACVGTLRTFGAPVPLTFGVRPFMHSDKLTAVVLAAAGAGCGAIAAKLLGETSWLDAKMYIIAGLAMGLLASKALPHKKKETPNE